MLDTQKSRDMLMSYDTDTGTLTFRLWLPTEQRSIEFFLLDTAVNTCLELLARNSDAVRAHMRNRITTVSQCSPL